jgi:DNA-binding transcriptional LysR family regulator
VTDSADPIVDWRRLGFDWNRVRGFLVTAEQGSFSAAARALGMSQPTIGRQVAALEEELGVVLVERGGSGMTLTTAGLEVLEHARAMGEAARQLSLTATGQSTALEGTVRITASELITAYLLPPMLRRLRVEHPGIRVELVADNAPRDLQRREADIAIRNFAPTQPTLVSRRLDSRGGGLYGSEAYFDRRGRPRTLDDLASAEILGFEDIGEMLAFMTSMGIPVGRANFPVVVDNHLVQVRHAVAGVGMAFLMAEVGDATPGLERVLPDFDVPVPIYLVSHRELRTSRRIRVVFDLLAETL